MAASKPWMLVSNPDYFRALLGSMVACDADAQEKQDVVVRFGLVGRGVCPNYQVEAPPHHAWPIRGDNHDLDRRAKGGRYDESRLSRNRLTFEDVQALLRACLERQADASRSIQRSLLAIAPSPPLEQIRLR